MTAAAYGDPDGLLRTRLRPALEGERALLQAWGADPQSPYDDWSDPEGEFLAPPDCLGELVVADDHDDPLGTVSWRPVAYGPTRRSQALEIGISLRPFAQGLGHGTRAQRMLVKYLFATTDVHRVQASTDVSNVAEQHALEAAGFSREGVLRSAQWRAGAWHDLVMYAVIRPPA